MAKTLRRWEIIRKLKSNPEMAKGWEMCADEVLFWLNYSGKDVDKELLTNKIKSLKKWITFGISSD